MIPLSLSSFGKLEICPSIFWQKKNEKNMWKERRGVRTKEEQEKEERTGYG